MKPPLKSSYIGYTVVEMLVVMVVIGILAAMAGPSWLGWLTRQRVTSSQAEALSAMREAQTNAKREKRVWQACFRDDGIEVKWSVHAIPTNNPSFNCASAIVGTWNKIIGSDSDLIAIDQSNSTLTQSPNGYYRIQFQARGLVNEQKVGKITFIPRKEPNGTKRCVIVSTLLGAIRTDGGDGCIGADD